MGTVAMHANATMRPGAYKPELTDPERIGNKSPKEIRDSFIGKSPRKTFCEEIGKLKKFIPSPAEYSPTPLRHQGNIYKK